MEKDERAGRVISRPLQLTILRKPGSLVVIFNSEINFMAKAVFIQSSHSVYDDQPGVAYHFPKRSYLRRVAQTVGDWVVFYEGRSGGGRGYFGVQRVKSIEDDPSDPTHAYAILDQASQLSFERSVPRLKDNDAPYETGLPKFGGFNTQAVRMISDEDFDAILAAGFAVEPHPDRLPRTGAITRDAEGFAEARATFDHTPRESILVSRKLRDRSFAKQVKFAYGGVCALSGLELRNGGGRPEVEAAHILPVEHNGPDVVHNGMALSGTLHWMFDRGLVGVDDDRRILVASETVASDTLSRLLVPDRKLIVPKAVALQPHRDYLRWHRENCFKG
ncbi:HNH endonuclease [Tritonibacter multivorans]|uniref:HNH endonuclease n=1 Tax=Tritonibacter multivorans TaxID=928856 RepID=UPI001F41D900|nr:HNH endonuclease [Tritonibacter multivorans]MDA7422859.1 HNH endonuclease [Tritonibacter multivorans]